MLKKKNKKFKLDFSPPSNRFIGFMFLLISFVILFFAMQSFFIGFHNTDLVFNYQNLAHMINEEFHSNNVTEIFSMGSVSDVRDETLQGMTIPLDDAYIVGNKQKLHGFKLMFISGFVFAIGTMYIFMKEKKKK